jgi:alpha-D-ribose 1-methylphosphonate 5-triphosphate synthase subunit PhnG
LELGGGSPVLRPAEAARDRSGHGPGAQRRYRRGVQSWRDAYIAGRARRQAEIAARFDALLQIADRREVLMARVIAPLAAAQEERRQRRWNDAVGTRVDFLTVVRG